MENPFIWFINLKFVESKKIMFLYLKYSPPPLPPPLDFYRHSRHLRPLATSLTVVYYNRLPLHSPTDGLTNL